MLDLACLNLTCLPTLVHDSYILKHISKPTIEKIFELYQSAGHQIFVSFDNIKSYTKKTIEIIENAVVLELGGNGNELYGKKFGDEQGDNNND